MKIRIRFGKKGIVKFIGHLDIMRYFQKAFRRAGLDIRYSQGFHPHPNMSFASPLGVGLESTGEYLDVELNTCGDLEAMKAAVNAQMTEGITVYNIRLLPDGAKNAMSLIAAADYEVSFREGMMPCTVDALKEAVTAFSARSEITVLKKTKKSEREMDIRPYIYQLEVTDSGIIRMQVSAGSVTNLKPELVMQTLCEKEGLTCDSYAWLVTRLDMYADDGNEKEGRHLVSLDVYEG
jgi:radical SAM-linked protein